MPVSNLERDIASWLAMISPDGDTVRDHGRYTIVPHREGPDTAGRRALESLYRVARGQALDGSASAIELGETIGEGGMGVVKLATQVAMGRTVAVKQIKPEKRSDAATMELLREAWITGALEHPNVIPVYSISLDDDGSPLVVLKRIEGENWSKLLANAEEVKELFGNEDLLEWNISIFLHVCNAIRFAHSHSIIHRDIKPDNVMIGSFGEVYVVDWGIAVSLVDDGTGRLPLATEATEMAGTPSYMAPEMLGGEEVTLSVRTDVYLLGSVLFELLTGEPPHQGDSAMEIITKVVDSKPVFPDDTPAGLRAICQRAMAPEPGDRFQTVEDLTHAVQAYMQHLGSMRLFERAQLRLDQLLETLEQPGENPGEQRERLYHLYGECRFGFREAKAVWEANERASDGLKQAVTAMAEWELETGEALAASTLLAGVDDAPDELHARVSRALSRKEREDTRIAKLDLDLDTNVGRRTRVLLAVVIGSLWTITPIAIEIAGHYKSLTTYHRMIWSMLGALFLCASLGLWARESLSKTAFNLKIFATVVFSVVAQLILLLASRSLGLEPIAAQTLSIFMWFVITTMVVIGIERRLYPAVFGYLVAALAAANWPEYRLYFATASNLLLTINAVVVWRRDPDIADFG